MTSKGLGRTRKGLEIWLKRTRNMTRNWLEILLEKDKKFDLERTRDITKKRIEIWLGKD